jgi:hypothetical protein
MILQLTSQATGKRVLICADSVSVMDIAGLKTAHTQTLRHGCVVDDGKHNNGGYEVEESYDDVTKMIVTATDTQVLRIMRGA